MKSIELHQDLNCFDQPDTQSNLLGKIPAGTYEVLQVKINFPNADTDYVQIFVAERNANVWLCSRYKTQVYGTILDDNTKQAEPSTKTIDETALIDLLPSFYQFTYDLNQPTYPFDLPNCRVPLAPPFLNNCCTFVEALLVKAWQNTFNDFVWDNQQHGQMMIYSAKDYFSPVSCLIENHMAISGDANSAPEPWTVIQGWKSQWKGGHTFIILDYHQETDRVLTLESNSAYQLNGVGYRMIGNLSKYNHPSSTWWKNDALWTWERVKQVYAFRKMAKLNVANVNWVSPKS